MPRGPRRDRRRHCVRLVFKLWFNSSCVRCLAAALPRGRRISHFGCSTLDSCTCCAPNPFFFFSASAFDMTAPLPFLARHVAVAHGTSVALNQIPPLGNEGWHASVGYPISALRSTAVREMTPLRRSQFWVFKSPQHTLPKKVAKKNYFGNRTTIKKIARCKVRTAGPQFTVVSCC